MKVLVLNGVNLNMTGARGPLYGDETLDGINERLGNYAARLGLGIEFFQSNIEGEIVDRIQKGGYDALIINAGAYSHYSIAIADALAAVGVKKAEVHMTNILAREEYRQKSVIAPSCDGCVTGFGADGYFMALSYIAAGGKW